MMPEIVYQYCTKHSKCCVHKPVDNKVVCIEILKTQKVK